MANTKALKTIAIPSNGKDAVVPLHSSGLLTPSEHIVLPLSVRTVLPTREWTADSTYTFPVVKQTVTVTQVSGASPALTGVVARAFFVPADKSVGATTPIADLLPYETQSVVPGRPLVLFRETRTLGAKVGSDSSSSDTAQIIPVGTVCEISGADLAAGKDVLFGTVVLVVSGPEARLMWDATTALTVHERKSGTIAVVGTVSQTVTKNAGLFCAPSIYAEGIDQYNALSSMYRGQFYRITETRLTVTVTNKGTQNARVFLFVVVPTKMSPATDTTLDGNVYPKTQTLDSFGVETNVPYTWAIGSVYIGAGPFELVASLDSDTSLLGAGESRTFAFSVDLARRLLFKGTIAGTTRTVESVSLGREVAPSVNFDEKVPWPRPSEPSSSREFSVSAPCVLYVTSYVEGQKKDVAAENTEITCRIEQEAVLETK